MCCWSCLFSSSSTNESICGKVSWKWQSMSCITKQGHVFQAYLSLAVLFLSCGSPHLDQACSGLQEISLGYKQAPYQAALHGFGEAFLVCGKLGFKRLPTTQLWGFTQCLLFYTPYKYKLGTVWWQHLWPKGQQKQQCSQHRLWVRKESPESSASSHTRSSAFSWCSNEESWSCT